MASNQCAWRQWGCLMADLITSLELDGLRQDFLELLGVDDQTDLDTTGTFYRVLTSTGGIDPNTLQYSSATKITVHSGALHVGPVVFRRDRTETAGGEAQRIRQYRALLPWNVPDILIDDYWRCDSASDPHFPGRVFRVTDVMYSSHLSARQVTLTDISRDIDPLLCSKTLVTHLTDAWLA